MPRLAPSRRTLRAPTLTYTLHDQEYGQSDIQGAWFILADSSGAYHCAGYWADPSYVLYLSDAVPPEQTFGYNIPQSDAFCTVSLVSYTPSPTDPTAVTVVLNFTFSPGFTGAYTVISQVNYYSGYSAPLENVGTLTLQAPPTDNPAPTVTLTDNTQSSGYYFDTDSFTITITGPPNLPVSVVMNGVDYGQCDFGVGCVTTNSSGVYTFASAWTGSAAIGSYTQTWYVDGVAATPKPFVSNNRRAAADGSVNKPLRPWVHKLPSRQPIFICCNGRAGHSSSLDKPADQL